METHRGSLTFFQSLELGGEVGGDLLIHAECGMEARRYLQVLMPEVHPKLIHLPILYE